MLKPLHDNVIVEVLSDERVSHKGIILKTGNDEERNGTRGKVVALSDGVHYKDKLHSEEENPIDFAIKVGDIVYFKEYSGTNLVQGETTYKVLAYEDIIAREA